MAELYIAEVIMEGWRKDIARTLNNIRSKVQYSVRAHSIFKVWGKHVISERDLTRILEALERAQWELESVRRAGVQDIDLRLILIPLSPTYRFLKQRSAEQGLIAGVLRREAEEVEAAARAALETLEHGRRFSQSPRIDAIAADIMELLGSGEKEEEEGEREGVGRARS